MTSFFQDLQPALRSLAKRPGTTVTILLTLALGIGANTAIFSVVDAVLLSPLPYPDSDRLVRIYTQFPEHDIDRFSASRAEYVDYRDESELFEELAAYTWAPVTLTGDGEPERLVAASATASMWSVLQVEAAHGRTFLPEEDQPGAAGVVVLSADLWKRRFGADRDVLGRRLTLDGRPREVVGVMPPGFRFPDREVDLWVPLAIDEATISTRSGHYLLLVGRSKPGVSSDEVRSELGMVVSRWSEQYEHAHPMTAFALRADVLGDVGGSLVLLLASTGFVLLIACVNVAGLLLAQGEGRRRELAVRTALGAGRLRLVRQLLTESAVLGGLGGVLAVAVAWAGLLLLRALEPGDLPRIDEVALATPVLLFTLGVSAVASVLFGLVPALRAWTPDVAPALREGARQAGAGLLRQRLRSVLVVGEVAVAVVLVVGAGLVLQNFRRLLETDPGLEADNVLTAQVSLPRSDYPGQGDVLDFYRGLVPELEALPGVSSASLVNFLPFSGGARLETFRVEGRPANPEDDHVGADIQMVTADYFRAVGIPLMRGRGFVPADHGEAPRVVILTESVARGAFPAEDPIGKRITILAARPLAPTFEVIGVVGDVRHFGAVEPTRPQIYLPLEQGVTQIGGTPRSMTAVLKTAADPLALASGVRRTIWEADDRLAVSDVATLDAALSETLARPRFTSVLLAGFGAVALALAALGIYGLLAHVVGLRRREFGIRSALGASRRQLIGLVFTKGLLLTGAGLALGLIGALSARGVLSRFLHGAESQGWVFAATPVVLATAALLACFIPARRAATVDPARALRDD